TLMKADLTTQMVFEFDSLEGVVGMLYARKEGIDEEIASAIFEHRLPRRAGDDLPRGTLGAVAGILDRFDTLAGYFGIGQRAKGTSDPFGLRRNALALLSIIDTLELDIDLEVFVRAALANYGGLVTAPDKTLQDILAFFSDRMAVMLKDQGYAYDLVAAALAVHGRRPIQLHRCLDALRTLEESQLQDLAEQAKRMQRIIKEPAESVDAALLDDNEKELHRITVSGLERVSDFVERKAFDKACGEILGWVPAIATYFEGVLVNDQNDKVRRNRHALLRDCLVALNSTADFTQIEKKT
ncbi:MAG: glycine--tRNA ligase subunit beta, partial [Candidatus Hydrogenedentes bacterium]|nr:glycine--tRNA ligase subunit beta [Candidatus Hydrogenedentota bacterium]